MPRQASIYGDLEIPPPSSSTSSLYGDLEVAPPAAPKAKTTTDQIWDFGKAFLRTANPVPYDLLKSIYQHGNVATIKGVVSGYGQAQGEQFNKARDAFHAGNYADAARYTAGWLIPFMGPAANQAGDKLAAGQYAEGAGETLGLGAQIAMPTAAGALAQRVRVPALLRPNLNPAEQAAINFGEREGIPLDAATLSGSPLARLAQRGTQNMIGGENPALAMQEAQTGALTQTAERLRQRVEPRLGANVYTPETSGQGMRGALQARVQRFDRNADMAYGDLRRMEQQSVGPVQVGTAQQPVIRGNTHLGYQAGPVMQDIGFPVDLRPVKAGLQPIFESIRQSMPVARQAASPGFKALENIMSGPDFMSASAADRNLSAIKSIAREADSQYLRNVSQGTAARVVGELDAAVRQAVEQGGGRQATMALQRGRALTRAKYSAADLLDDLKTEPVQAFRQLTARGDSAINLLREVRRQAPQTMPQLARAYLDNIFDVMQREGGFGRTDKAHADWFALGPAARQELFQNPALVHDLDNFFLLSKRIAKNPNPSGSGFVVTALTSGLAFTHPVTGALGVLSTRALSTILQTPGGARLLTRGMQVPLGSARAAALGSQIMKLAGNDIQEPPPEQ